MTHILAIDQGTTSSRCLLFDKALRVVDAEQEEFPQYYPQPSWAEHDPVEIITSVKNCMRRLLGRHKVGIR